MLFRRGETYYKRAPLSEDSIYGYYIRETLINII